jgi:hypothetical protein
MLTEVLIQTLASASRLRPGLSCVRQVLQKRLGGPAGRCCFSLKELNTGT